MVESLDSGLKTMWDQILAVTYLLSMWIWAIYLMPVKLICNTGGGVGKNNFYPNELYMS